MFSEWGDEIITVVLVYHLPYKCLLCVLRIQQDAYILRNYWQKCDSNNPISFNSRPIPLFPLFLCLLLPPTPSLFLFSFRVKVISHLFVGNRLFVFPMKSFCFFVGVDYKHVHDYGTFRVELTNHMFHWSFIRSLNSSSSCNSLQMMFSLFLSRAINYLKLLLLVDSFVFIINLREKESISIF